ncbi:MAG: Rrf2 family transcriptional regulator [Deltaproteobacteria bacterium]|nr:Rrf2 family transcriptional regulator [Deltaproteobacteria bacterium]
MKLSTKTRYGARLLFDLARHYGQGPVNIGDIAKRQDISVKYLEQIIRPLKKADLVESVRGPKGGHVLAKNPSEISLGQIVRLLESGDELVECVEDPIKCERSSDCCVRRAWQEATIALYDKLNSTFLTDLLKYEREFKEKGDCNPPARS